MCANFQAKCTTLTFLPQICPKMDFWLEIQKTTVEIRTSILEIPFVPMFKEKGQLWLFWPKFARKWIWGRNFKTLSVDLESTPPKYHVCQFSVKMDNFEVFSLNLGKLPNYVWYFGSNNIEGVAESWLEAEMSWMEVDGAGWRLKWAGWRWMELGGGWNELGGGEWSWVEVGGAGWRWVHGLVIPI